MRFVQNIRVTGWFMLLPTFVVALIKTDQYIIEQMAENSNSDEVAERWHWIRRRFLQLRQKVLRLQAWLGSKWLDDWKTRKTKHDHISYPNFQPHIGVHFTFVPCNVIILGSQSVFCLILYSLIPRPKAVSYLFNAHRMPYQQENSVFDHEGEQGPYFLA